MLNKREVFKELLRSKTTILAPGAYDGLSAKIIESLGFDSVYVTGYGVAASRLGMPDIGFCTMSEVVDQARNINEAINLPVICDADTGYGGVLNVYRTVISFEKAGIVGIHIEDQASPKKCGALSGRKLVSMEEMVSKIKIAVNAREDNNFVIIARTDARSSMGLEEAKRRLHTYLDSGADLVMVAERYPINDLKELAKSVSNKLAICGGTPGWEETNLPFSEYEKWGVKLVICPTLGLHTAGKALYNIYKELKEDKHVSATRLSEICYNFDEFNELMNLSYWSSMEKQY